MRVFTSRGHPDVAALIELQNQEHKGRISQRKNNTPARS